MFTFLVSQSLKNRLLVLAFAAVLVVYGLFAAARLPVDVLPDLNKPTVTIMTEAEGLAPPEVEQRVTFPIEAQMNGVPGVTRVRSTSGAGLSIVYVEFEWSTEIYHNRQQVAERLALLRDQLPVNVTPQMGPVSSIMGQVLMVALTAPEGVSPFDLREVADFTLRPHVLAVPGVAQVIPMGGAVRQFRVAPNPAALRALGVTLDQVEVALRGFGANASGGFVNHGGRELLVRALSASLKLEDLAALPVAIVKGTPVRLDAVAEVSFAARMKRGDAGFMGKPAVILSIEKQPEVDAIRLTRALEAALAEIGPRLPHGISAANILFRQANFIETSIANLKAVLLEAVVVVAIILFAFLLNVRTTAISLIAIPVSVLATAILFTVLGLSINTMTLGGLAIAIGELVDDAVVDVENIFRRLRENRAAGNPRSTYEVVIAASNEVRSGIVYATAIIVLVFVPLFALTGIARMLEWAFDHTGIVFGAVAGAVLLAVVAAFALPRAFLPPFNEGTLTINATLNPGISLEESQRLGLIAERLILEVPEVALVKRGALERLPPVLMTALSAGLALLPLMIDAHAPGKEILYPVAITIFGGLVSATLLDAVLTPLLVLTFGCAALHRLTTTVEASASGTTPQPTF